MSVQLNERVFHEDERRMIQKLIDRGAIDQIMGVFTGSTLSLEKEYELNHLIESLRPVTDGFVSKYKDDMARPIGREITPEMEAETQAKMTAEYQEWKDKREAEMTKRQRLEEIRVEQARLKEEVKKLIVKAPDVPVAEVEKGEPPAVLPPTPPSPISSEKRRGRPKKVVVE